MASKYDSYWESIMDNIQEVIMKAIKEKRTIVLKVKDIKHLGDRKNWNGYIEVSSKGIKGDGMAHATSLGKLIFENKNLMAQIRDRKVLLKISNSLDLKISVIGESPVQEKRVQPPKRYEPLQAAKTFVSQDFLFNEIHSLLESLLPFDYKYKNGDLPLSGIYFFYEDTEKCVINGKITDRIVRVGTHDEDGNFRTRIGMHFKGRNKNISVFRKHVGSAIINKNKFRNIPMNEWMKQGTPTNMNVEDLITESFRKKFTFRCIPVDTKKVRKELEEKLIATLSACDVKPSPDWLGIFAERIKIRKSGLWNVDHVGSSNLMRSKDLERLKHLINITDQTQANKDFENDSFIENFDLLLFKESHKNYYPYFRF